jgi:hypothetical protein
VKAKVQYTVMQIDLRERIDPNALLAAADAAHRRNLMARWQTAKSAAVSTGSTLNPHGFIYVGMDSIFARERWLASQEQQQGDFQFEATWSPLIDRLQDRVLFPSGRSPAICSVES